MKIYSLCILLIFYYQPSAVSLRSYEAFDHLGTRTPYRFKSNKDDTIIKYPGCQPKKIWMMIRHGTRNPGLEDIKGMSTTLSNLKYKILTQHKNGKGNLTLDHISDFEDWSNKLDIEKKKNLVLEGQEEMILLAERTKRRFPGILKNKYNNKTFLFQYTATERTQQSARYFANGLFSQKEAENVIFAPAAQVDTVLRFYKHCDKWQKQVKKNPDTYKECKRFAISPQMNKTLKRVSKTLGLTNVLSLDQVKLMFKICGYETAWNKYFPSPWCAAFDKESAEVMEYFFDLKDYWVNGYGLELTYRQACLSIKNMFENLSHKKKPKAMFLFAHSGTVLKIISHLGLYKPESHLTADNFDKGRAWKTSNIDCFAANLAFVLFDCQGRDHVLTLHQEHIIKMPSCDSELCPLDQLTQHYRDSILNCDYEDMCKLHRKDDL